MHAGSLFAPEQSTPVAGLQYRLDFLSEAEEAEMLRHLSGLPFAAASYKQYSARRLELLPRSAYTLRDEARWGWQHSIAPTPALRYSITFRTLK